MAPPFVSGSSASSQRMAALREEALEMPAREVALIFALALWCT